MPTSLLYSDRYSTTLTHVLQDWWLLLWQWPSTGMLSYGRTTSMLLAEAKHYFIVWKDSDGYLTPPDPSQQHWANKKKVRKVCAETNDGLNADAGGRYVVTVVTGRWTMEEE